jgi:hypothetical protein
LSKGALIPVNKAVGLKEAMRRIWARVVDDVSVKLGIGNQNVKRHYLLIFHRQNICKIGTYRCVECASD